MKNEEQNPEETPRVVMIDRERGVVELDNGEKLQGIVERYQIGMPARRVDGRWVIDDGFIDPIALTWTDEACEPLAKMVAEVVKFPTGACVRRGAGSAVAVGLQFEGHCWLELDREVVAMLKSEDSDERAKGARLVGDELAHQDEAFRHQIAMAAKYRGR